MRLVFVRHVGTLYNDENIYETFFTKDMESVLTDSFANCSWDDDNITSNSVEAPKNCEVFIFNTSQKLTLAISTYMFNMSQIIDGVAPLAWSDEPVLGGYLKLGFGMSFDDVETHLYDKNMILKRI